MKGILPEITRLSIFPGMDEHSLMGNVMGENLVPKSRVDIRILFFDYLGVDFFFCFRNHAS